jgi:hypothetical protein
MQDTASVPKRGRPFTGRKSYTIRVKPDKMRTMIARLKPKKVGEWIEEQV